MTEEHKLGALDPRTEEEKLRDEVSRLNRLVGLYQLDMVRLESQIDRLEQEQVRLVEALREIANGRGKKIAGDVADQMQALAHDALAFEFGERDG